MYLCGVIHEVIFVMTKKLLMLCAVVLAGLSIYAQEVLIDVVHLKNGSTIKGFVTEQIPDKGVKVQTPEGSLMFFDMKDVVKIVKEVAPLPQSVVMSLPNPYQHGFVRKSPFTAGLLSCIIPGLGQLYANKLGKRLGTFHLDCCRASFGIHRQFAGYPYQWRRRADVCRGYAHRRNTLLCLRCGLPCPKSQYAKRIYIYANR